jgi:hypothetical protein
MSSQLLLIVPKTAPQLPNETQDRERGIPQGYAELTVLNLSGLETRPVEADSFVEKLLTPISNAMHAMETKFKGLTIERIKISLAVTAEGEIGIASAGVKSSIEVMLKWPTPPKVKKQPEPVA